MRVLFVILLTLATLTAQAEYRVFVLKITNSKTQKSQTRYSTMDPLQYKTIYPLSADETIEYVDTWRCKGNTSGFKVHCAKPPTKIGENQSENNPQN